MKSKEARETIREDIEFKSPNNGQTLPDLSEYEEEETVEAWSVIWEWAKNKAQDEYMEKSIDRIVPVRRIIEIAVQRWLDYRSNGN